MLEPVRQLFASDPDIQMIRQKAYPAEEGKDCSVIKYLVFINLK